MFLRIRSKRMIHSHNDKKWAQWIEKITTKKVDIMPMTHIFNTLKMKLFKRSDIIFSHKECQPVLDKTSGCCGDVIAFDGRHVDNFVDKSLGNDDAARTSCLRRQNRRSRRRWRRCRRRWRHCGDVFCCCWVSSCSLAANFRCSSMFVAGHFWLKFRTSVGPFLFRDRHRKTLQLQNLGKLGQSLDFTGKNHLQ